MRGIYLISCLLLLFLNSCDILDTKEETIPSYLTITSADLQTTFSEGAPTSNIVDATVYVSDNFVGTYELPATVPILRSGATDIKVAAGIKNNGLTNDRRSYPFYTFITKEVTLIPDATTPINATGHLTFNYYSDILHFEIEDFEGIGYSIIPTGLNNAEISQISAPPQNVKTSISLQAVIPADTGRFDVITDWDLTNLPKGNSMYLEIDFKGTVPLEIGIYTLDPTVKKVFALGLVPQEQYTKVYVELTDEISRQVQTQSYQIYLSAQSKHLTVADSVFIDNLKFIYP